MDLISKLRIFAGGDPYTPPRPIRMPVPTTGHKSTFGVPRGLTSVSQPNFEPKTDPRTPAKTDMGYKKYLTGVYQADKPRFDELRSTPRGQLKKEDEQFVRRHYIDRSQSDILHTPPGKSVHRGHEHWTQNVVGGKLLRDKPQVFERE